MPALPLSSVPAGTELFIDSNVLVYALTGKSAECQEVLSRFVVGEITAYVSADVLSDVAHRLIIVDATASTGRPYSHRTLKADKVLIRSLSWWQGKVEGLLSSPLVVDGIGLEHIRMLPADVPSAGLLGKDALIYRCMKSYGVTALASNDSDFDDLDLDVYKPTDVLL